MYRVADGAGATGNNDGFNCVNAPDPFLNVFTCTTGFLLRSKSSPTQCLRNDGGAVTPTAGTRVEFTSFCNLANARWNVIQYVRYNGEELVGQYYLRHASSGLCLGHAAASNAISDNDPITLQTCTPVNGGVWYVTTRFLLDDSDGAFYLQSPVDERFCAHGPGGVTTSGTDLVWYSNCETTASRRFETECSSPPPPPASPSPSPPPLCPNNECLLRTMASARGQLQSEFPDLFGRPTLQ